MTARSFQILVALSVAGAIARGAQPASNLFAGRYKAGERMTYLMKGVNENWKYQIQASGVIHRNAKGGFVVEYTWSRLVSNGDPVALPPSDANFREVVSLDPGKPPSLPNLAGAPPMLIGPITDLGTFYVDLWLANKLGSKLNGAGDHADLNLGIPAPWADGKHVLVGVSAVDFDFTVVKVDRETRSATLLVRHVPPAQPRVPLPAAWMRKSDGGTPNNWVQVATEGNGFVAGVGIETFDVQIKVSLADGKILSASMENLVKGLERNCRDTALTNCGDLHPFAISRHMEVSLKN